MKIVKGKKYSYRTVKDGASWTAEILRRKTSTEIVISKSQSGFSTESDAQAWGERELKSFLQNLSERNKRHSEQREKKARETSRTEPAQPSSARQPKKGWEVKDQRPKTKT